MTGVQTMQANQTDNGPIFIVGYIHTGTSLLKSMLRLSLIHI